VHLGANDISYFPCHACRYDLRLDDLAGFNTAGTDANALVCAVQFGLDRPQVDVPAPAAHVVRVRHLVAELRTLTADCAELSHNKLQCFKLFAQPERPAAELPRRHDRIVSNDRRATRKSTLTVLAN
jgi:hypothetical protein